MWLTETSLIVFIKTITISTAAAATAIILIALIKEITITQIYKTIKNSL